MIDTMLTILQTSAHELGAIPDGTVQAIITSPPYYGLRSYSGEQDVEWPAVTYRLNEWCEPVTVQGCEPGCAHEWGDDPRKHPQDRNGNYGGGKQLTNIGTVNTETAAMGRYCLHCGGWRGPLGLEPSPVAYIGHLILCLREWRRVLRDDGVCWVNLGDSYASQPSWGRGGGSTLDGRKQGNEGGASVDRASLGLKPKDLLGIPWMFAIAARADGWWLRSDVIWAKPNPMPESVTDRPTKAHEYIFLLTKSARYWWDADAVREEKAAATVGDPRTNGNGHRRDRDYTGAPSNGGTNLGGPEGGRNIRSVWNVATQPYAAAHYAVWPERLVEPMVKAATSERGCCPRCGAGWVRITERGEPKRMGGNAGVSIAHADGPMNRNGNGQWDKGHMPLVRDTITLGWEPSCACLSDDFTIFSWAPDDGKQLPFDPVPCTVLDPFAGSGTTGRVAIRLGRRAILCDISGEYLSEHVPARTTVQIEMAL